MTPAEVSEGLGLDTLKGRQWSIHKSCAIKGEGLEEGLDWYARHTLSYSLVLVLIRASVVKASHSAETVEFHLPLS